MTDHFLNQPSMPLKFNHDFSLDMVDDEAALQDNIVVLNTVRKGEVLMNVDYGTNLSDKVFEQNDVVLWLSVDTSVRELLAAWEPRVRIVRSSVTKDSVIGTAVAAMIDWVSNPSKVATTTQISYPYGLKP